MTSYVPRVSVPMYLVADEVLVYYLIRVRAQYARVANDQKEPSLMCSSFSCGNDVRPCEPREGVQTHTCSHAPSVRCMMHKFVKLRIARKFLLSCMASNRQNIYLARAEHVYAHSRCKAENVPN
eukprot:5434347-Pleurochrysis_carterae.AAC.1